MSTTTIPPVKAASQSVHDGDGLPPQMPNEFSCDQPTPAPETPLHLVSQPDRHPLASMTNGASSELRLHLDEERCADDAADLRKLDGIEALNRLFDAYGGNSVVRWVKFLCAQRGVEFRS